MSQMNTGPFVTREAGADLSSSQYRFVKTSSGKFVAATAGTDKIVGVLQNTPASGQAATVQVYGTAKVRASAAISEGAYVTATTGGKAVATTTAGDLVRGIALEAASADGDIIEILLVSFHHKV